MKVGRDLSRNTSIAIQLLAYILVLGLGYFVLTQTKHLHPLQSMLIADVVCTFLIFGFSLACNNSSLYDPYWSLVPIYAALGWIHLYDGGGELTRIALTLGVISLWGIRLTWNFLVSWPGMDHEDWRYLFFREKFGRGYWLVSFTGIHFFPTLLVYAGLLSAWAAISSTAELALGNYIGAAMSVAAVIIQGTADNQLRAHRASNPPKGSILKTGLWKYSRHPNYFGEVLFWWGLWVLGYSSSTELNWLIAGPLGMTALFLFSSVPWTDKKTLESRPEYEFHMKQVSGLIPWFPKSSSTE